MKKQVEVSFILEFDHDQERQHESCAIDTDKVEEILVDKLVEKLLTSKKLKMSEAVEWLATNMDSNCFNFVLINYIKGVVNRLNNGIEKVLN